jgi:hypothetical protein
MAAVGVCSARPQGEKMPSFAMPFYTKKRGCEFYQDRLGTKQGELKNMALRFFLQLFVLDGMGHAEHASRRLGEIENSAALAFFSGFHVKFQI